MEYFNLIDVEERILKEDYILEGKDLFSFIPKKRFSLERIFGLKRQGPDSIFNQISCNKSIYLNEILEFVENYYYTSNNKFSERGDDDDGFRRSRYEDKDMISYVISIAPLKHWVQDENSVKENEMEANEEIKSLSIVIQSNFCQKFRSIGSIVLVTTELPESNFIFLLLNGELSISLKAWLIWKFSVNILPIGLTSFHLLSMVNNYVDDLIDLEEYDITGEIGKLPIIELYYSFKSLISSHKPTLKPSSSNNNDNSDDDIDNEREEVDHGLDELCIGVPFSTIRTLQIQCKHQNKSSIYPNLLKYLSNQFQKTFNYQLDQMPLVKISTKEYQLSVTSEFKVKLHNNPMVLFQEIENQIQIT